MKGILGVLLFEVSILKYVIQRDLFRGYFVGPCGDYIVDHSLSIPRLLAVVIVVIMVPVSPRLCCAQAVLLLLNVYWALNCEMITV